MPTNREFTVSLDDRPGTLAQLCRSLADRNVNILAIQATPGGGGSQSQVRFVVDNPTTAKTILDREHKKGYTEAQVAQVTLANRPGELAAAATRLSVANINVNHVYSGLEPTTNAPILIFSVADAGRASTILEQTATSAAHN